MDKTIENIWKEGFLPKEDLISPKITNLYNQKSIHIIDKIIRMIKINFIAIIGGGIGFLIISFFMDIPVMGVGTFIIVNTILLFNWPLMKEIKEIDKGKNSYEYLTSFNTWLGKQLSLNRKLATFYYPALFLSVVFGMWFNPNLQQVFQEIISKPNEVYLFHGFPVLWSIPVILISFLLAVFGARLYNLDVRLVYGSIFNKLKDIIRDMEELRA